MKDQNIELPPLPPLHIVPSVEPVDYPDVAQALMDYARDAVKADRQRRGEPVPKGWKLVPETPTSKQIVHMALQIKGADADGWFRTDGDDWPEHVDAAERAYKWVLSEAPQRAEPSGLVECGLCHNMRTLAPSEQPAEPDYKALYFKEQALRMEAEACADMLRGDEPVKRKRRYAQGTALGEFGIIPMCDQADDEPMKVSDDLAHEIWAAAQTAPGEGIEDAVERVAALLARYGRPAP